MFLVGGLGNPGGEYASSRHNIGFIVADRLVTRWGLGMTKLKFAAEIVQGEFAGRKVMVVKPQEFMNSSGPPIQRAAAFYQIDPHDIIIVHDDIDLELGRLKVKVGGGHAGHNGIRSITEQIGPAFVRIRCGVGHPGSKERVVGHVLGSFTAAERKEVPLLVERAAAAVETILRDGVLSAMNAFNSPAGDI